MPRSNAMPPINLRREAFDELCGFRKRLSVAQELAASLDEKTKDKPGMFQTNLRVTQIRLTLMALNDLIDMELSRPNYKGMNCAKEYEVKNG